MTTNVRTASSPGLTTTAGDYEREARSRSFNFVEAMVVMAYALAVLWVVAYPGGVMGGVRAFRTLSEALIVLGSVYILFVAPRIHHDTLESWGLGNPRRLWQALRTGPVHRRILLWIIVISLFLVLNVVVYRYWGRLMGFLNLRRTPLRAWDESFPGRLGIFAFGSIASLFLIGFCIRYDNFLSAFRTALILALPLLALTFAAAAVHRGRAAFVDFRLSAFAARIVGYLFWGCFQQLLFSSYFGTRIRKAFGPAPEVRRDPKRQLRFVFGFGVLGALAAGGLCVIFLRHGHGPESMPWTAVPVFGAFFLLPFAAYGWAYVRDRNRLLAATLNGTFFGLFHLPSYGLSAITFGLGVALSYVFMEDRNRNLVALGFVHGLLGSAQATFFRGSAANVLAINRQVGPWNVRSPTWPVLIVPVLCLLLYAGLAVWRLRCVRKEAS